LRIIMVDFPAPVPRIHKKPWFCDCISKGLAEITKSKQPTVQFIHESVRDYLVTADLMEGPSHERLKRYCTAYLHHPSVRAVVNDLEGGGGGRYAAAGNCSFLHWQTAIKMP
jgi:hypothetical protein